MCGLETALKLVVARLRGLALSRSTPQEIVDDIIVSFDYRVDRGAHPRTMQVCELVHYGIGELRTVWLSRQVAHVWAELAKVPAPFWLGRHWAIREVKPGILEKAFCCEPASNLEQYINLRRFTTVSESNDFAVKGQET